MLISPVDALSTNTNILLRNVSSKLPNSDLLLISSKEFPFSETIKTSSASGSQDSIANPRSGSRMHGVASNCAVALNSASAFVQNVIYANRIAIFSKSYCP
ncbi:hypothetical protein MRB53_016885 [Persea americana]|uniref:Uncharacterized protein n=1 Tax=Persea americana TaxID=3435 RepID=A0ACC2M4C9_PERAE|nr:hypothetical protein MRB53_016885 [Persea americana]